MFLLCFPQAQGGYSVVIIMGRKIMAFYFKKSYIKTYFNNNTQGFISIKFDSIGFEANKIDWMPTTCEIKL